MRKLVKVCIIALVASVIFYELFFVITFGRMPPAKVFITLCIPTGVVMIVYKRHLLPKVHSDKELAVYMLCLIASLIILFILLNVIFERIEGPLSWETIIASSIFNSFASYSSAVFSVVIFFPLGYLLFNAVRVLSMPAELYYEEPGGYADSEEETKSLKTEFLQFLGIIDDD